MQAAAALVALPALRNLLVNNLQLQWASSCCPVLSALTAFDLQHTSIKQLPLDWLSTLRASKAMDLSFNPGLMRIQPESILKGFSTLPQQGQLVMRPMDVYGAMYMSSRDQAAAFEALFSELWSASHHFHSSDK